MKIGIEAQRLFRSNKHGMEIVTLELIRQLQKIDKVNEYVIFVKEDVNEECILPTGNFKIHITPNYNYPMWEQFYLPKLAKREGVDLLHCTSNTAPLLGKTPLLLTLHDIIYIEQTSFAGTAYQNFGDLYRKFIVPRVIDRCSSIITVSAYEKAKIVEKLFVKDDKVEVVYNAINKSFREISDESVLEAARNKYGLPPRFILHFGNTAPKKNTAGVLEAYAQYFKQSECPLPLVITDCTIEYVEQLVKKVRVPESSDLISQLIVLDHIPFDQLPSIYNCASVFLYPSLRESFGMPILEAMACGTPVITSETSSMPEISEGAAYLVDPTRPQELAEGMDRILKDDYLRTDLIGKGLSRAAEFSWENTARQVLKLYDRWANVN